MSAIQKNVESASERHAASFTEGHLALPPAKKYLVLTCMDARIDPAKAFGIGLGDAHVIRNVSCFLSVLLLFFFFFLSFFFSFFPLFHFFLPFFLLFLVLGWGSCFRW